MSTSVPPSTPEDRADVRVAIVLASAGRPELLGQAAASCSAQEGLAFRAVLSVPDGASLPSEGVPEGWEVVMGARGLAAQRNAALDALGTEVDVVAFFDDDAVLRPDYVSTAVQFLAAHPDVVGLTGDVLIDGATTGEVSRADADQALAESVGRPPSGRWRPTRELYGCNFVVRVAAAPQLRFDARLPLYSWLEDHDFARRLMRSGVLAKVDDCVIVHRAASSGGRQAHTRLGYSQVMNPVYLVSTGSFPVWLAVQQVFRPVAKNVALSPLGSARKWRRERLRGNLRATADLVRGRITPERITSL